MASCDRFVLLDVAPYSKNSYQNRCRIRGPRGAHWLTVPVLTRGHFAQPTFEARVSRTERWADKHWRTLVQNYGRQPYFGLLAERLAGVYARHWDRLADLNGELLTHLAALLGIATPRLAASDLGVSGRRSELLCAICRAVGATVYLSGASGRRYLDAAPFAAAGIELQFQDFTPPVYEQGGGDFVPGLSIVDLLVRHGPRSMELLKKNNE
jgi:hypothetical protein